MRTLLQNQAEVVAKLSIFQELVISLALERAAAPTGEGTLNS
ncbi:MAG: hypothetical protein QNJ63_15450 [Calothrix sp. MO_192.B10]|nr:hypothetical protein [Calothrix sp. MO_192.B10]